jgi:hypothetical protein
MIMPDFWGEIEGEKVFVTAVLERTVVYVDGNEKKLTKRENVFVDPRIIEMRPVANTASWRSRGKVIASKAVPAVAPVVVAEPTPEALAAIEEPETPEAEEQV